jgi:hypothetical protein
LDIPEWVRREIQVRIKWVYGGDDGPFLTGAKDLPWPARNRATHRIVGARYRGKGALGEDLFFGYVTHGSTGYDFGAAESLENLTLLLSPFKESVTLVHGDDVKLVFDKKEYPTIAISKLDPRTTPAEHIYVSNSWLFSSERSQFHSYGRFHDLMEKRANYGWDRVDVLFIREIEKYLTSIRYRRTATEEERQDAEKAFRRFYNESYHSGFSLILDSQREVEAMKSIRDQGEYAYYKNMGGMPIPERIYWIMRDDTAQVHLGMLKHLRPDQFVVVSDNDSVGFGRNSLPSWHITRGAKLLRDLGIRKYDLEGNEIDTFKLPEQAVLNSGTGTVTVQTPTPPMANPAPAAPVPTLEARPSRYVPVLIDKREVLTPEEIQYLQERVRAGERASQIWRALVPKGYKGTYEAIRSRVYSYKVMLSAGAAPPSPPTAAAAQSSGTS